MVVSVKELHQRRRSSMKDGKLTVVRAFLVTTDDIHDGPEVARLADGVPRYGNTLNGDEGTRVTSVDADPVQKSGVHWEVVVEYTGGDGTFEPIDVHPLEREPEYSFGGDSYTEPYFLDESQPEPKAFVNAAGDPFEQLWERDKGDLTITLTKNVAFWSTFEADEFNNTTNADIVFIDGVGYAPDVLKMGVITAVKTSEVWQGLTVDYYKATYPIKVRKSGWKDKPLNYGYNAIRQVTKDVDGVPTLVMVREPIVDRTGTKITKPWPLTLEGKAMPSATDQPPELEFLPYPSVPWGPLALE